MRFLLPILTLLFISCQGPASPIIGDIATIGGAYVLETNPELAPYVPAITALPQGLTPEEFNAEVDNIILANPPKPEDAAKVKAGVALLKLAYRRTYLSRGTG